MDRQQLTKEEFRFLRFHHPVDTLLLPLFIRTINTIMASCLNVSLTLSSIFFIWLFILWFATTQGNYDVKNRHKFWLCFSDNLLKLIIFVSFHNTEIRKGACPLFNWAIAHHTLYCTHCMPWSTERSWLLGAESTFIVMFSNANWLCKNSENSNLKENLACFVLKKFFS